MIVLSLFDGVSCGYEALRRLGINIETYYASEIDTYAQAVSRYNYPDIIRLGDVTKWKEWDISWKDIDFVIGGSPCQGFSFAGRQLNFKDPRSKLFFEFANILRHVKSLNPDVCFFLENVKMRKDFQAIITDYMKVKPILIDASLVSAQSRKRLYWTNIDDVEQPKDRNIYLKDVILNGVVDREKSHCITASVGRTTSREYWQKNQGGLVLRHGIYAFTPTRTEAAKEHRRQALKKGKDHSPFYDKLFKFRPDGKSGALMGSLDRHHCYLDLTKLQLSEKELSYMLKGSEKYTGKGNRLQHYSSDATLDESKSHCITSNFFRGVPYNVLKQWDCIRKFHPIECERLQTFSDGLTALGIDEEGKEVKISNTQRYKMIGNAWCVEVIVHIF